MTHFPRWELEPGVVYHWTLGTLSIWISRTDADWLYAWSYLQTVEPVTDLTFDTGVAKPEDLAWTRVIAPDERRSVSFAPRLADRGVVIKSDESVTVLPRSNAELHVPLPVWLVVSTGESEQRLLFEAPTRELHRRWFGSSMQGSLCYSVFSRLCSDHRAVELQPVSAICPIRIRNHSNEQFCTDSVFVQASQCRLYRPRSQTSSPFANLEASTVVVTVAGSDELSFAIASDRSRLADELEQIADWRKRPDDSWWKRGYMLFQRISNY